MRELLGRYKYRGHERLAPLLGLMLDSAYIQLESFIGEHQRNRQISRAAPWQADLLVPVPVSESRLIERGFNQAERLADVLSRRRGIPQLPLLIRTHHTGKQSFKSRAERIAAMKHAFDAIMNESVKIQFAGMLDKAEQEDRPMQIIIIDDIYTTGSTIRACAEVLQHLCACYGKTAEVYSLTWARS
ncbi:ComF family protein [Paenibacillus sp. FSL R7-0345]|uniref:ComF family protein n=1 Tax=Paenibacillus sp. FSL R7-0345 TaxID=2954535 RepID=UPI00315AFAF7